MVYLYLKEIDGCMNRENEKQIFKTIHFVLENEIQDLGIYLRMEIHFPLQKQKK